MKRIITSGGAYDGPDRTGDLNSFLAALGKERKDKPKVTILPTGKFDKYEDRSEVAAFIERGCEADALLLSKYEAGDPYIKETILSSDIIYATSGNLMNIMREFKRTGADVFLKQAYENGTVLFGSSSGAMCWYQYGYDDCGPDGSLMFVEGLGLIPYSFCPHYDSDFWKAYAGACKTLPVSGIAAENGCAVTYFDGVFGFYKECPTANAHFFDKDAAYAMQTLDDAASVLNAKKK